MRSVHRFTEPKAFLARAASFLRTEEAENALMLGICGSAHFDDSCYLATVEEDEAVVACAVRTPPHSALLTRADRWALELLLTDLADKYQDLSAVAGPEPAAGVFARLWSARTGEAAEPAMRMRVFEAHRVVRPPTPAGTFRVATEADLPVVAQWTAAFIEEAGLDEPSDPEDIAAERILEGSLFIWEGSRPVSMAAWAGRTGRIVRINYVYTLPEHRGRGYASACVASLTQQLLDEGFARCCLYTDLANPTSNKIYQAIGYRPVCDAAEYHLGPARDIEMSYSLVRRDRQERAGGDYAASTEMHGLTHPHHDVQLGPATHGAVDEVVALARSCAEHMAGHGILQWDDVYPDRGSIERDVREGSALLARRRGEVVAYFAVDSSQDPEYASVDWHLDGAPIAVVHRLMVSPAWQGRGLGRWCMAVAEQRAAQAGCVTMRLDAFTGNPRAIRLYERRGYRAAGVVHFRTGEFTCFEKALGAAR